jgi:hypothetical protein
MYISKKDCPKLIIRKPKCRSRSQCKTYKLVSARPKQQQGGRGRDPRKQTKRTRHETWDAGMVGLVCHEVLVNSETLDS